MPCLFIVNLGVLLIHYKFISSLFISREFFVYFRKIAEDKIFCKAILNLVDARCIRTMHYVTVLLTYLSHYVKLVS